MTRLALGSRDFSCLFEVAMPRLGNPGWNSLQVVLELDGIAGGSRRVWQVLTVGGGRE
jgi:hypothetical protein